VNRHERNSFTPWLLPAGKEGKPPLAHLIKGAWVDFHRKSGAVKLQRDAALPCGGNVLTLHPTMSTFKKIKDQTLAKVYAKVPSLVDLYARRADLVVNTTTPFTPLPRPLRICRVALITTAGLHLPEQEPFDMSDKNGDPSYREIPSRVGVERLTITHDYFPRADAAADPNLVLPVDPLRELVREGAVGSIAPRLFSFMGHIQGDHLQTLTGTTAPEVARALKADAVDAVFLTPV